MFSRFTYASLLLLIQSATWLSSDAFTISKPYVFTSMTSTSSSILSSTTESNDWNGEVVSNTSDGRIQGCTITKVPGQLSLYSITIDGIQADLGKFSEAIYRKICSDAKQQRFQGFRPGTIPPHLVSTYIGFAMDECAREATLEAMSQNDIRPFDETRMEMTFDSISIMPPKKKGSKKKKKGGAKRKNKGQNDEGSDSITNVVPEEPQWVSFETMKEAIDAGWKPGQSFSFIARNVKGQQLNDQSNTISAAEAVGVNGSSLNLNTIQFDGE